MKNNPFRIALTSAILLALKNAKKKGVAAITVDNLAQLTNPPSQSLEGAPRGTNARYFYMEMFREICAQEKKISSFILN